MALSAFSIYLISMHPMIRRYFKITARYIYESYSGFTYLLVIFFTAVLFCFACIIIDQIRLAANKVFDRCVSLVIKEIPCLLKITHITTHTKTGKGM